MRRQRRTDPRSHLVACCELARLLHRVPPQLDGRHAIVGVEERDLVGPCRQQLAGGPCGQHGRERGATGRAVSREDGVHRLERVEDLARRSRRGPTRVPPCTSHRPVDTRSIEGPYGSARTASDAVAADRPGRGALHGPQRASHRVLHLGQRPSRVLADVLREVHAGDPVPGALAELIRAAERAAGAHRLVVVGRFAPPQPVELVVAQDPVELVQVELIELVGGDRLGLRLQLGLAELRGVGTDRPVPLLESVDRATRGDEERARGRARCG